MHRFSTWKIKNIKNMEYSRMLHRNMENMEYALFTYASSSRAHSRVKLPVIGDIHQLEYIYISCVHKNYRYASDTKSINAKHVLF